MDFLLEVGCEEIPARFVPQALKDLSGLLESGLEEGRLRQEGTLLRAFGTPRRLCVLVHDLAPRQEDLDEEVLGPKVEAAYDDQGQPTKACMGFARSRGAKVEDLKQVETSKGKVVALHRHVEGQAAEEVMGDLTETALGKLAFPKTMRWGEGTHAFARPVHWLLALLDDKTIELNFAGVKSGRMSRGHRFSKPDEFQVAKVEDFIPALRERDVWVEVEDRRDELVSKAHALADQAGGKLLEDQGLVQEVSYLIECPVPLLGRFDEAFLELPRNVLVAAMRNHQRYFSVEDGSGKLLNAFVAIGNTPVENPEPVRHGYVRVLTARLEDARFFYEEDKKTPLVDRVPELQEMVFQADLGSYYEKSVRVAHLAVDLAHKTGLGGWDRVSRAVEAISMNTEGMKDAEHFSWRLTRAALLAKTDLLTEMVGEFPELQGEMGGIYSKLNGEEDPVAAAIEEHYLPRFAGDQIPDSQEGALLSLADRLDTLAGGFGVGLRPTGGADPYALRRQCLGVIAIIQGKSYRLSLKDILAKAVDGVADKVEAALLAKAQKKARKAAARKKIEPTLPTKVDPFQAKLVEDLMQFFQGRLRQRMADQHPHDVVDAVLAAGMDDMVEAGLRVEALGEFVAQPAFADLGVAFKRVANIIKDHEGGAVKPELLKEATEKELFEVFEKVRPRFEELVDKDAFQDALGLLASDLRAPVDAFFENVLVNDPDDLPRQNNRKDLLAGLAGMFGRIADFTRLNVRD